MEKENPHGWTTANVISAVGLAAAMVTCWVFINQRVTALEVEVNAIENVRTQDRQENKEALTEIKSDVKDVKKTLNDIYLKTYKHN